MHELLKLDPEHLALAASRRLLLLRLCLGYQPPQLVPDLLPQPLQLGLELGQVLLPDLPLPVDLLLHSGSPRGDLGS